jgi:hypothetical protein
MTSVRAASSWTAPAGECNRSQFRAICVSIGRIESGIRSLRVSLVDIGNAEWLRAPRVRALIAAALAVSLLLGGAFLVVSRLYPSPTEMLDHPVNPVSDAASAAQVVESAQHIVNLARLQTTSAGYLLMSCKDQNDPPYQGAIYLTFTLPAGAQADTYFKSIGATLVSHGWREGLPPNDHTFGKTVSKDAVTAVIYPLDNPTGPPGDARVGVLRAYGECRNVNDHRNDASGWIDITNQFPRTG